MAPLTALPDASRGERPSAGRRVFGALVGVTLAGQLCAMLYEIAVAGRFGTGAEADALALALTLALAVANEVVGWISTLFVPHYIEAESREGPAAAERFFRASVGLVAGGGVVLTGLLIAGAPPLVAVLAPGLAGRAAGVRLLRLFAPVLLLLPVSMLLSGALQARGRFVVASLRQLCWYGLALASVLALAGRVGAAAVPAGMVAGLVLFCALLGARLAAIRGRPRGPATIAPRLRRVALLLLPLALASGANYVNIMVERGLAARLPEGSLAALTYAFRLLNFPINLLVLNATTMLLPPLALHAAQADAARFESLLERALRLTIVFTVPIAALAIALAGPGIRVLLERGAFTAESTRLTAAAVVCYAPGVIGIAGAQVLARAYQALHEVRRLVWTGIAVIALNVLLMSGLTAALGFRGLPLAVSLSALTLFLVMLLAIASRLPGLAPRAVLASAGRALLAGLVAIACVWAVGRGGALARLLAGGAAGAVAYGLALWALGRDDARLALAAVAPARLARAAGRP